MNKDADKKLEMFFGKSRPMNFKKREVLIRADDDPTGVFYLKSGYVKMNSISENGTELTLNIFKPGSFFPMTWAVGEVKNTNYFQAMTDAVVYKATRQEVVNFLKKQPEILFDLTRRILIGLDGLLTNIQYLLNGNAHNRVASALIIFAKRFGQRNGDGGVIINLPLTHQDIANLAGLTRETASTAIGQLEKRGIVSQVKFKFIVKDINELKKEILVDMNDDEASPIF